MTYTATVTSKRQLTLPTEVYNTLNLKQGSRLTIRVVNNTLNLQKVEDQLHELRGSLKLPKRFEGLDLEEVIQKAKDEYFTEKYKDLIHEQHIPRR